MFQALIGPVSGLIGSWMDKKTEEQRGKSAIAKAKAEAEAAVMVSAATSTAEWEKLMAKGSQSSWKDEWLNNFVFDSLNFGILWGLGQTNCSGRLCGFGGHAGVLSIYLGRHRKRQLCREVSDEVFW